MDWTSHRTHQDSYLDPVSLRKNWLGTLFPPPPPPSILCRVLRLLGVWVVARRDFRAMEKNYYFLLAVHWLFTVTKLRTTNCRFPMGTIDFFFFLTGCSLTFTVTKLATVNCRIPAITIPLPQSLSRQTPTEEHKEPEDSGARLFPPSSPPRTSWSVVHRRKLLGFPNCLLALLVHQGPVVRSVDNAIPWINPYPADKW